jgi:transposase
MAGRDLSRRRKKGAQVGRTTVFVDEAGFRLSPSVVRTYAPRGETPVLREVATRDHLSVISGVTPAGQLFTHLQETSVKGPDVVRFLQHLERQLGCRLLVVWDGASIHRGSAVQEFLGTEAGAEIELAPLPGYAPDCNPDEEVWGWAKGDLANLNAQNLAALRPELRYTFRRMQQRPALIRSFFAHAGYESG